MLPFYRIISICAHGSQKSSKLIMRKLSTSYPKLNISLKYNANYVINKTLVERYLDLPMPECVSLCKYVWIDGTGSNLRSKTKTLDFIPKCVQELPVWTCDGCSTFQAECSDSEIYLCPRVMYNDPIRRGNNKLVLCDSYTSDHKPTKTNKRAKCVEAMDCVTEMEPWFGIEQEFTFIDINGRPVGWPSYGFPESTSKYYCGVGADKVVAREIIEGLMRSCLYAGVQFAGSNAETIPAQWEYQIGPGLGIRCADDVWMSRFLLQRIAEEYGVIVTFDPRPVENWSGAGTHVNFSTKQTRCDNGLKVIEKFIDKLKNKHSEHMKVYDPNCGADNARRLTGKDGTPTMGIFTSGVGTRNTSIRIPKAVSEAKKGYVEDRRPSANCDPYSVCEAIVRTCLLDK